MNEAVKVLKSGGVVVLPTDTIYGLHALAQNCESVEKIYQVKSRGEHKPLIVLISDLLDLKKFGVEISPLVKNFLNSLWPNPISVILPTEKFENLHRGTNSLAFRMPDDKRLLSILKETGPLVSTSANPEGQPPAETLEQAKEYFGSSVDFYLDAGKLQSQPSTIIKINGENMEIIRQGSFAVPKLNL